MSNREDLLALLRCGAEERNLVAPPGGHRAVLKHLFQIVVVGIVELDTVSCATGAHAS